MTIGEAIGWVRKRHPRDTALATVDAVNRRDWEQLRTLLAEDFFYIDGEANRIETPERFVSSVQGLVRDAPDLTIDVECNDTILELEAWLRVQPTRGRFYVEGRVSHQRRDGNVGEVESSQTLRRYFLEVGVAL